MASKGKTAKNTVSGDAVKKTRAKRPPKKGKRLPQTSDRKGARQRGNYSPNYEHQDRIFERQQLVRKLRGAGRTYREISAHLKANGYEGASVGNVVDDYKQSLKLARKDEEISSAEWLQTELDKLEGLEGKFYHLAVANGDTEAAAVVLRTMRERDRYLGISKAQQSQTAAADQLAKFLGMDPEELPNGDGTGV